MRRATEIRAAGDWSAGLEVDRVVLDAGDRHRRRMVFTGEAGTTFLLDLPHATVLRDGDGLLLDDGGIVRVAGLAEPLVEISAATPVQLVRLAWHLGNRHTDVQIAAGKLRIRRDHVLEDMVTRLGASAVPVVAPFSPEPGSPPHHDDRHPGGRHGA
jgi:urease accessory protein